ncbi:PREDICTED: UDP-glucuronosyltransferase 2B10-like [Nicrophorus vespilloides]|uniref:UDP-glucuronosyltransferase n=1 Tax=Nicrophorus vespilloides TaxID=110193 RepID=A0ABM1MUY9_NICVS|nr:PREDICTED: UDP-glucuronosyltransferase 2B10-like [Nicrophorus vespilloides]
MWRILGILCLVSAIQGTNILYMCPIISPSHHFWNEVLANGLAQRGHNVTILSHDDIRLKHENYTLVKFEGIYEALDGSFDLEGSPKMSTIASMDRLFEGTIAMCSIVLETEGFKQIWNYPKDFKFDLIIWDANGGECMYPLIKRFGNPPVVVVSPFGLQPSISDYMGHHVHSYSPFMIFPFTDKMTFWQRMFNVVYTNYVVYYRKYFFLKKQQQIAKDKFGVDMVDDFQALEKNLSLALVNTDPVYNYPETYPPNIIPVAGIHIQPPKPLNKAFSKIINDSKNGVILFALGSNVKSERINPQILESFGKCFETLPYTILWKIKDGKDLKLSKNVITESWIPQNDVLANPKTKLFITHGGALSTQESIYNGVPMLVFPFFYDQLNIAAKIAERKIGDKLDYFSMTPEYVCGKINKILGDERYTRNVKVMSDRARDQQNTPLESVLLFGHHRGSAVTD